MVKQTGLTHERQKVTIINKKNAKYHFCLTQKRVSCADNLQYSYKY